jgi:hypothetical protein
MMIMNKVIFLMVLSVLAIGCEKEDQNTPGTLEVVCRANWDGVPLVIGSACAYPPDLALKFYELDYILSNLRFRNSGGEVVHLKDIALVSFTENNTNEADAMAGQVFQFDALPTGSYDQLTLGIGVDSIRNATLPQDYPTGHPLSISANRHWTPWNSFIFSKLQGLADISQSGSFVHPFSYHSGGTALYREISFTNVIQIEAGKTTKIVLDLDVRKLLQQPDGSWWDIENQSGAHTPHHPAMLMIMDNYANALTLN